MVGYDYSVTPPSRVDGRAKTKANISGVFDRMNIQNYWNTSEIKNIDSSKYRITFESSVVSPPVVPPAPPVVPSTTEVTPTVPALQNFNIPGGTITLYNINNIVNKFYEVDSIDATCQNTNTCASDADCSSGQECADILGDGVSKCYSFVEVYLPRNAYD